MNKKIMMSAALALCLSAGVTSFAAVPEGGVLLDKEGAPLEAEMTTPPKMESAPMPAKSAEVLSAMAELDHSSAAVVRFTVTTDGTTKDAEVTESSGKAVLDQYALDAVKNWTLRPARNKGNTIAAQVSVPIRFTSMKVVKVAVPKFQPDVKKSEAVKDLLQKHPDGALSVKVTLYVDSEGKPSDVKGLGPTYDFLSEKERTALREYAEKWVSAWTFEAAQNGDGQKIGSDAILVVSLK